MGKTGPRLGYKPASEKRGLTPKQMEILQLIADGLQTKEIARKLSMSPRTVEAHRAAIRHRLETREGSIGHAVATAMRAGLISLDGDVPDLINDIDVQIYQNDTGYFTDATPKMPGLRLSDQSLVMLVCEVIAVVMSSHKGPTGELVLRVPLFAKAAEAPSPAPAQTSE